MEITIGQLSELLKDAAELGAQRALSGAGLLKPYLNKTEASFLYGPRVVDRWLKEKLITPRKDGTDSARWRLDRIELESVARTSNRRTYLSIVERNSL